MEKRTSPEQIQEPERPAASLEHPPIPWQVEEFLAAWKAKHLFAKEPDPDVAGEALDELRKGRYSIAAKVLEEAVDHFESEARPGTKPVIPGIATTPKDLEDFLETIRPLADKEREQYTWEDVVKYLQAEVSDTRDPVVAAAKSILIEHSSGVGVPLTVASSIEKYLKGQVQMLSALRTHVSGRGNIRLADRMDHRLGRLRGLWYVAGRRVEAERVRGRSGRL